MAKKPIIVIVKKRDVLFIDNFRLIEKLRERKEKELCQKKV